MTHEPAQPLGAVLGITDALLLAHPAGGHSAVFYLFLLRSPPAASHTAQGKSPVQQTVAFQLHIGPLAQVQTH